MKYKYTNKFNEAISYYKQGKHQQSILICEELIDKNCEEENVYRLIADNKISMGLYEDAALLLYKLIKSKPKNSQYRYQQAIVLSKLGKFENALEQLRQSVKLDPTNCHAWSLLAGFSGQQGDFEEAISSGLKAVALSPKHLSANMNLASAYDSINSTEKAREYYEICAEIEPNHPVIQCKLGDVYIGVNEKMKAEACYRKAIFIDPSYTHAYRQISRLIRYTSIDHEDFININAMLDGDKLSDDMKSNLHFALGKMYEDCALYDESFKHLEIANRIENNKHKFNKKHFSESVSNIISIYTNEFMKEKAGLGDPSEKPVFIVGMPRSGSTLIEQVIASHPQAFGAGELYWFGQIEYRVKSILAASERYPECARKLSKTSLHQLAGDYLNNIASLSEGEGKERITDKLLGNFMHLGIISLMFPNANIIHCRRNPLDTCFSIYSILFPGNVDFSHDLDNIGFIYNEYTRLMQHWESVLPGRILTIDYEDLVSKQEGTSKCLIEFIDLKWNDDCLNFFQNKRQVSTVSAPQVRQEMYTSSIGRWKHFEKHLGQLFKVLDPMIIERVKTDT